MRRAHMWKKNNKEINEKDVITVNIKSKNLHIGMIHTKSVKHVRGDLLLNMNISKEQKKNS